MTLAFLDSLGQAAVINNELFHVCSRDSTLRCDQAQNILPNNIVKPVEDMAQEPRFCMVRNLVEKRKI